MAILTLVTPHYFNAVARSGMINKHFRRFCADYGMPITIIAATGLAYWGRFDQSVTILLDQIFKHRRLWRLTSGNDRYILDPNMGLPVTDANFQAANNREWLVRFWQLEGKWVGIALPFGFILFILFYFDANVSVSQLRW